MSLKWFFQPYCIALQNFISTCGLIYEVIIVNSCLGKEIRKTKDLSCRENLGTLPTGRNHCIWFAQNFTHTTPGQKGTNQESIKMLWCILLYLGKQYNERGTSSNQAQFAAINKISMVCQVYEVFRYLNFNMKKPFWKWYFVKWKLGASDTLFMWITLVFFFIDVRKTEPSVIFVPQFKSYLCVETVVSCILWFLVLNLNFGLYLFYFLI